MYPPKHYQKSLIAFVWKFDKLIALIQNLPCKELRWLSRDPVLARHESHERDCLLPAARERAKKKTHWGYDLISRKIFQNASSFYKVLLEWTQEKTTN